MSTNDTDRWRHAPFQKEGPPEPIRVFIFFSPWWWVWLLTGFAIGWAARGLLAL